MNVLFMTIQNSTFEEIKLKNVNMFKKCIKRICI